MNLFELFVKIGVDDQASGKLKDLGGKLGNGLKTAAKIGTAAVGAAAAGITALTTAAVNNYAEYEQLVGGVDTLFKSSSQKVQEYAANAFRTAGMSANEYMSTVTSFSASLLQSLGGDTDKAAEYANQALTDMSDNANKMGTDMSLIQNAYQGFAKANYTMLDNLKLGYGGTQSEMQRLIADAAELSDTVDAQDMSFANIVKAINVVQTEMGITGTTAKEAASTISGSVGMVKSSWTNLVTGIADDNANLDTLIDNFVESVSVAAGNIAPRVEVALDGVLKLVDGLIPKIATAIPSAVAKYAPKLISSGVNILKSLVSGIKGNAKIIVSAAKDIVLNLIDGLVVLLPDVIDAGVELLSGVVEAVPEVAQKLLISMPKIVNSITRGLAAGTGRIIKAVRNIFAPVEDIAEIARENLSVALSLLDPFSENVKKASDSVIDVSKSLSKAGNTISDVEQDIEDAENEITKTLKLALAEQQGLREQDLQNIDKYNDLIRAKEAEKLSIYQDAQIAELRKTILSLANADEQDLAKLLGKSASALEAANQAAESAYTNELIRIENIHKAAGTTGGKQYEEDLKQAKAFYDSLLQQNESVYNQTLSAIFERSQFLVDAGLNEFEKIKEYVDSVNSYIDRWNLTTFLEKDKDFIDAFGIMGKQEADFASGLENLDYEAANAFLSLATTMVNSGTKLDRETQNVVDTILSAFEYIPGEMGDISKEALLKLVDGLEEQIPKLENAGEMTAEEIIKAIEDHFKNAEIEVNIGANAYVGVDGSHANGLSYVPYDGYIAELHKGERVLTEKEARGFSGNTFNITVNGSKYQNEDTLAEAIAEKIQQITERRVAVYA